MLGLGVSVRVRFTVSIRGLVTVMVRVMLCYG